MGFVGQGAATASTHQEARAKKPEAICDCRPTFRRRRQFPSRCGGYWKNDTSSYRGETNQKTAVGARAKHGATSASARSGDVKQVQTALQTQGLYDGPVDGIYGPGTRNAVKKYQSQAGITQTGQLDQQTMQGLTRSGSGSGGKTTQ